MSNRVVLLFILVFFLVSNIFAISENISFKYKEDFFYKLFLDKYSPETIKFLEESYPEFDSYNISKSDRAKLELLKKKLQIILKKQKMRKKIIGNIFNKLKLDNLDVKERIIKNIPLTEKKIDKKAIFKKYKKPGE